MTVEFQHTVSTTHIDLKLMESIPGGLFRRAREEAVNPENWSNINNLNFVSSLARLQIALEDRTGDVEPLGTEGFRLSHQFVASLSDAQAQGLGLPPTTPFALSISATGSLLAPQGGKIRITWKRDGGRPVAVTQTGCIQSGDGARYRLPLPTLELITAVDEFNKVESVEERLDRLGAVTSALSEVTGMKIKPDDQLAEIRIAHATCLSLEPVSAADGIDFNPVLFGKEVETDNLEEIVERDRALLTEADQEAFNDAFRSQRSAKSTYLAGRTFVYIDPAARTAAEVIREAQQSSREIRQRFVRSPESFIRKRLIDSGQDTDFVDELSNFGFVVTDQLSERVKDLGVWTPPIIPFKVPSNGDWKTIEYGIKVGDKHILIPQEELRPAAEAVANAMQENVASITLPNKEVIPATTSSLSALNTLVTKVANLEPVLIPDPEDLTTEEDDDDADPAEPRAQTVLQVESNLEDQSFAVDFSSRAEFSGYVRPAGLLNEPKPHQEAGLSWLQETWSKGFPGVLLADDMGLGKTFQTLGFLSWLTEKREALGLTRTPIMIVAPTSLLGTWENEAKIHLESGQLGEMALLYGGGLRKFKTPGATGNDVSEGRSCLDIKELKHFDWVLTTYETMRDYHISLAAISFSCIVFDEMQKIKNISSLMTNAAQTLSGDFKLGLTGTPVENSLSDIWTLFDTLIPGGLGLGSLTEFGKYFIAFDEPEELQSARMRELSDRLLQPSGENPPPMLRRLKIDVAKDLPPKHEHLVDSEMPKRQAAAYHEALTFLKKGKDKKTKIEGFMRMRSSSLHPEPANSSLAQEPNAYISESARLSQCIQLLDQIHSLGEKALVFVESIDMHEWLAPVLKYRYQMNHTPERIYGAVSAAKRQGIVDRFQSPANKGFDVLLLSPKAAGVGLTLTAATNVIHLTRWWNPAVEDQCTDRAYRIGQTKPVNVYYPRALHPVYGPSSFDVIIHNLLENKRGLSRGVLVPNDEKQTIDDLINGLEG